MTSLSFWLDDPTVLLKKDQLFNIFPNKDQSLAENMNAITRFIIYVTILVYIITRRPHIILIGFVMCLIVVVYYWKMRQTDTKHAKMKLVNEGFKNILSGSGSGSGSGSDSMSVSITNSPKNINMQNSRNLRNRYTMPTKENPMMNMMLPEIDDNPGRKRAAPSYDPEISREINQAASQVPSIHFDPENPESHESSELNKKLFQNLGDTITHEQSMRNFYTMPNTQLPNDQAAFAEFCYGSMVSCKEGDEIQCEKKNYRHINM
jgi:hypothetical protein